MKSRQSLISAPTRLLIAILGLITAINRCEAVESRVWTPLVGQPFTGELTNVDKNKKLARIKVGVGMVMEVEYEILSEPDRALIEAFSDQPDPGPPAEPEPEIWKPVIKTWTNRAGQTFYGELIEVNKAKTIAKKIRGYHSLFGYQKVMAEKQSAHFERLTLMGVNIVIEFLIVKSASQICPDCVSPETASQFS